MHRPAVHSDCRGQAANVIITRDGYDWRLSLFLASVAMRAVLRKKHRQICLIGSVPENRNGPDIDQEERTGLYTSEAEKMAENRLRLRWLALYVRQPTDT